MPAAPAAELGRHRESVDHRLAVLDQRQVERLTRADQPGGFAGLGGRRRRAPQLRLHGKHAALGRVGGDHQHLHARERRVLVGLCVGCLREKREVNLRQRRAVASATNREVAVHHLDQAPRGLQAERGKPLARREPGGAHAVGPGRVEHALRHGLA